MCFTRAGCREIRLSGSTRGGWTVNGTPSYSTARKNTPPVPAKVAKEQNRAQSRKARGEERSGLLCASEPSARNITTPVNHDHKSCKKIIRFFSIIYSPPPPPSPKSPCYAPIGIKPN